LFVQVGVDGVEPGREGSGPDVGGSLAGVANQGQTEDKG